MAPEANRIQGKNQSLYAEPIDRIFNPYRKDWMHDYFRKFAKKQSGLSQHSFGEYVAVLKEKAKKYSIIYELVCDNPYKCEVIASLIKHKEQLCTGYTQWEPMVRIIVESGRGGIGVLSLVFEGRTYSFCVTLTEFGDFLENLCTLPQRCDKEIVHRHFAEFLPEDMRKRYAHVIITEDMGRSSHGGGEYTFGHEVELHSIRGYRFRYAYVAGYLWANDTYETIHNTVRVAEDGMKAIVKKAPGMSIVTNHGDDCGTHLIWTLPDNLTILMEKIEAWSDGDAVTLDTVKEVIDWFKLSPDRVPPADVLRDYVQGMRWREEKTAEIGAILKPREHGWMMYPHWDSLRLYVTGERGWAREAYIDIPYDCPQKVYIKLLEATDEISDFCRKLKESKDYFTSIGLFTR